MFIQPVSMKIPSQQDYERDLKQQLKALGYHEHGNFDSYKFVAETWNYLGTRTDGQLYKVHNETNSKDRYVIPIYNPQLFLALAAMTTDENGAEGEYYYCTSWIGKIFEEGNTYPIIKGNINGEGTVTPTEFSNAFRKATKEELIEHFKGVETVSPPILMQNLPPKLTVGQKGRVVQDTTHHGYKTGEIVTVTNCDPDGYSCVNERGQHREVYTRDLIPAETPRYKVGDRVRIVQNTTGHGFGIGETVTVLDVSDKPRGNKGFGYGVKNDSGTKWRIHEIDAELSTHIPKYFVVKRDNSPEWREYINWLSNNYLNWGGEMYNYYGYHGANTKNGYDFKGTAGFYDLKDFKNNPQVFETAKEFMKLVNQQSNMKRILKRDDFKAILNTISPECKWYQDLINTFKDFAIKDEVEVSDELYIRGRKAADPYQNVLLDKIFGKDTKDVDLSKYSNDNFIRFIFIRKGGNYENKAFFLSPAFNWELTTDSEGTKVLVPTYK